MRFLIENRSDFNINYFYKFVRVIDNDLTILNRRRNRLQKEQKKIVSRAHIDGLTDKKKYFYRMRNYYYCVFYFILRLW